MNRRSFLQLLTAIPLAGRFAKSALFKPDTAAGLANIDGLGRDLYVSLHGPGGAEVSYPGYARVAVERTIDNWKIATIDGVVTCKNAKAITFGECKGGHVVIDRVTVASDGHGGDHLFEIPLTRPLHLWAGVTPEFRPEDLQIPVYDEAMEEYEV